MHLQCSPILLGKRIVPAELLSQPPDYLRGIPPYEEDAKYLAEELAQLCHRIAREEDWSPRRLKELIEGVRKIVYQYQCSNGVIDA